MAFVFAIKPPLCTATIAVVVATNPVFACYKGWSHMLQSRLRLSPSLQLVAGVHCCCYKHPTPLLQSTIIDATKGRPPASQGLSLQTLLQTSVGAATNTRRCCYKLTPVLLRGRHIGAAFFLSTPC
jgi:hypothetical protein